jgi:hypothetical protein
MTEQAFSIGEFREWAKDHEATDQTQIHASFEAEVRAASDAPRALDFVISTSSIDRMGDTVSVNGWRLENYLKNNPVLWQHNADMPPIAKGINVRVDGGKLMARAEFVPADNPAIGGFAEGIYQLYRGGFLNAVSVGFRPLKYEMSKDPERKYGIDFKEQELLEFSCVNVPALPEALNQARSKGIDVTPIRDWAMKILALDNLSFLSSDRLAAINSLANEFRADAKKASGSKGASGIYRRCANRIEKAVKGEETADQAVIEDPVTDAAEAVPEVTPAVETAVADDTETMSLELARLRLDLAKRKFA